MKKIIVKKNITGETTYYLDVNGGVTTIKRIVTDFVPGVKLEDGDELHFKQEVTVK